MSCAWHEAVTAEAVARAWIMVGFDRNLSIRREIDRHCANVRSTCTWRWIFDNVETIKQAVQIGVGVGILPEPTVRSSEARAGTLAVIPRIAPDLYLRRWELSTVTGGVDVHAHGRQVCRVVAAGPEPPVGGGVMRDREVLVRDRPSSSKAYVLPGTRLVNAAAEAGIAPDVACGGEGLCGKWPRAGCRRRRRADGGRTPALLGRRAPAPVGGWPASRPVRARWKSTVPKPALGR